MGVALCVVSVLVWLLVIHTSPSSSAGSSTASSGSSSSPEVLADTGPSHDSDVDLQHSPAAPPDEVTVSIAVSNPPMSSRLVRQEYLHDVTLAPVSPSKMGVCTPYGFQIVYYDPLEDTVELEHEYPWSNFYISQPWTSVCMGWFWDEAGSRLWHLEHADEQFDQVWRSFKIPTMTDPVSDVYWDKTQHRLVWLTGAITYHQYDLHTQEHYTVALPPEEAPWYLNDTRAVGNITDVLWSIHVEIGKVYSTDMGSREPPTTEHAWRLEGRELVVEVSKH